MSVQISHDKAYQDYLSIRQPGRKSATIENLSAILKQNDVEINPKPSDPVSFFFWLLFSLSFEAKNSYNLFSILVLKSSSTIMFESKILELMQAIFNFSS